MPCITSYNHRSMNVDFRPFRCYPRNAISHDPGHFRSSDFGRRRSHAPCMIDCKQNPTLICALDHELQPLQHQRMTSSAQMSKIHSLSAATTSATACRYWLLPLSFPTAACCTHRIILFLLAATNCLLPLHVYLIAYCCV